MDENRDKKIKGTIYCIRNSVNSKIYVGSTQQLISKRLAHHKYGAKYFQKNSLFFQEMNTIGADKFFIEPLKEIECETLKELRKEEGKFIENTRADLNQRKAGRDTQQYYRDKKEMFQKRYENNIDKIKARDKERYKQNFDKIQEQKKKHRQKYPEQYKERDKQYYQKNREAKLQKHKEYVEANPEKMKEYYSQYYLKNREKKSAYKKERYRQLKEKKQQEYLKQQMTNKEE